MQVSKSVGEAYNRPLSVTAAFQMNEYRWSRVEQREGNKKNKIKDKEYVSSCIWCVTCFSFNCPRGQ